MYLNVSNDKLTWHSKQLVTHIILTEKCLIKLLAKLFIGNS